MFRFVKRSAVVGMLFWVLVCFWPAVNNDHAGYAKVIDANVLEIKGEQHRLYGIVKGDQTYEQKAIAALTKFLAGKTVKCQLRQKHEPNDKQFVSTCYAGREDVAAWMVGNGLAMADRSVARLHSYVSEEGMARSVRKGFWKKAPVSVAR